MKEYIIKTYITIKKATTNEIDIKKSRFITNLQRVNSADEAKDFIEQIKKENYKATHNCYAYIIGEHNEIQNTSDNGEPSRTAGVPMLDTLKLMKVQNVVAVVTRYFGGIKLGAGGLVRAYSNSVSNAIQKVGRVQGIEQQKVILKIAYNQLDPLKYWLNQKSITISDIQYAANVTIIYFVKNHFFDIYQKKILNIYKF